MTAPYTAGTIDLVSGSEAVAGNDTAWQVGLIIGGTIYVEFDGGNPLPIAAVDSDTEITAALKWTGPTGTYSYAIVRDTAYGQQTVANAQALATYIQRLNNPALAATAGVSPGSNKLLLFTGPNSATVIDLEDLLQGVRFDEEVPTLADRAPYDGEAEGFRILVADIGDGRSAFFSKKSAASGDWSVPFYISGPIGDAGPYTNITIGDTTTLPPGSEAEVTFVPVSPGVIRLDFALPKGADGSGTGDFSGPAGGVANGDLVAFLDATGKQGRKAVVNEVRKAAAIATGPLIGFRNKVVNGNFRIWQRATGQNTSGYGSADRWQHIHVGTTKTVSRQDFGPGALPFDDDYYCRTVVSSVTGAANQARAIHKIESVRTLAGKKATITFWARTSGADRLMAVEVVQDFGSGGSPSESITGIAVNTVTLSSTLGVSGFQKYSYTVDIPPISGKTIGSNSNDNLAIHFWFDAGTSFNARTGSLGHQSGTFDLAHVSIVEGDATVENDPFEYLPLQVQLSLCQRFFCAILQGLQGGGIGNTLNYYRFPVQMRATPSLTVASAGVSSQAAIANAAGGITASHAFFQINVTGQSGYVDGWVGHFDAEL